jgi:TolB-like protein
VAPSDEAVMLSHFINLSGDAGLDWIGLGVMETLRAELADDGFKLVDRDFQARWVIGGSYQRFGKDLRVTVRLSDVKNGHRIVMRINGPRDALFELQDQIAQELAIRMQNGIPSNDMDRPIDIRMTRPSKPPLPDEASVQVSGGTEETRPSTVAIDGPPPPVSPAVINRDPTGRATVRAVRVGEGHKIDGRLDESVYNEIPPMSDFIQVEPVEGAPATEKTDVWLFFDNDHIYISLRCWDSMPESEWILNEMRRDNTGVFDNESVAFLLDTFYDRRNGGFFLVNAIGGRMDAQVTNELNYNPDWNPIWEVTTGRFEGGWTAEIAIPFKSLRYRPGVSQVWGFQVRRFVRWKNEYSYLTPIPAGVGLFGTFQASLAATVVGLEVPGGTRTLEIKPYAIADVVSDRTTMPEIVNEAGGDIGLDVKYGVTQNLVADLTVNTDFAQVEADEQQVNLTRFSLFFPEKREFFLENQGLFEFGGAGTDAFFGRNSTPILFYSRQIGLDEGREVPIEVGGRLTGRVGKFSVGAMSIRTGEAPISGQPSTNFTVLRIKRDILRRSSVGVLFTGRSVSKRGFGSNEAYGVDGAFAFYDNLRINTYWAQTQTPGLRGDDVSYRGQLDYGGDRYGLQIERLAVGEHFNPEVGFLERENFERSFGMFRFSPRPESIEAIRKLTWQGQVDYITNRKGVVESRNAEALFSVEFENSDQLGGIYLSSYEFLEEPFRIASDVTLPVGSYDFHDIELSYTLGSQRLFSGRVSAQYGSFFGGDKTTIGFTRPRVELSRQLSLEPGFSFNRVALPQGSFTTQLVTTRTTYTMTPEMFVSALLQYNSSNSSLGANIRLRWEYQPGSELFVVFNEQRETIARRLPELQNRSIVVKINRLFRF